ncbi:enolase C-terminal domain-like protein [Nakamurella deserti]|uniref:enolase C-terminal domain-like protein n=1 Tax=Nakamurella deserti TaxID=2164074 RepID=UPI000DBE3BD5|nr:enolase C-terminal domain-like protein [Nakamurella deserti]
MTLPPIDAVRVVALNVPTVLASADITSPMDAVPQHRHRRASWYGSMGEVLVEVAAGSLRGVGMTHGGQAVTALIRTHLGPLLVGTDPTDVEAHWDRLRRACYPYGTGGLAAMARSALDLALWDIRGRAAGVPVTEWLGGGTAPIPVYATGDRVAEFAAAGFTAVKIGMSYGPWDGPGAAAAVQDRLTRARGDAGPDLALMADAWMGWTPEFIAAVAPVMADVGLRWLEEPLPPDHPGMSAAAGHSGAVPVASGEHLVHPHEFSALAAAGVRIWQPDVMWCGGLTAALQLADLAQRTPVATTGGDEHCRLVPHLGAGPFSLPLVAARCPDELAEWFVGSAPGAGWHTAPTVVRGAPTPDNGWITPSAAPGFGITIDEEAVNLHAQ